MILSENGEKIQHHLYDEMAKKVVKEPSLREAMKMKECRDKMVADGGDKGLV